MGLSWQQGPLSPGAIGRFLVPEPLPKRLLYAEPLRRCMRVRFGGKWIADSEHVLLLFEPGRYPMAYFPETDVSSDTLQVWKLGDVDRARRSRNTQEEIGTDTLFSVHNQCMGDNSQYEAIYRRPGLFANVLRMQEEFRARWLDYYR
jgi:Domain of unknown function (DUF427)